MINNNHYKKIDSKSNRKIIALHYMVKTEKIQCLYFGRVLFANETMLEILEYSGDRIPLSDLNQITSIVSHSMYSKVDLLWLNRRDTTIGFSDILRSIIYDPENTIQGFSSCKCCERHQTHRPTKLEIYWEREFADDWMPSEHTHEEQIRKRSICACPCRHRIRWTCRVFMPEPDPFFHENN